MKKSLESGKSSKIKINIVNVKNHSKRERTISVWGKSRISQKVHTPVCLLQEANHKLTITSQCANRCAEAHEGVGSFLWTKLYLGISLPHVSQTQTEVDTHDLHVASIYLFIFIRRVIVHMGIKRYKTSVFHR